ncbi:MAG: PaaX family transcriptional regulator [Rhodobacteraceae bacterium]|nr:PaaX family transcriptional regulator [Paracoccaceae bacterium]
MPLRAAGFIVTLYGDVVVPRGGEVWIGTVIEACAAVGISETLVRTAVSRLVSAGQLEGWRRGRRSFYRLTDAARAEFEAASRVIYGPPEGDGAPARWRFVHLPELGADGRMVQLERAGYARLRPQLAVGVARGEAPRGLLCFEAEASGALGLMAGFAAQAWDLEPHAAAYRAFLERFAPVDAAALDGAEALAMRLLLVHAWRGALLRDPRLPAEALPVDWPGHAARGVFVRLYAALSPAADSQVAARFEGGKGPLPAVNAVLEARAALLARGANSEVGQGVRGGNERQGRVAP